MTKNVESPAPTEKGQAVHDTDKIENCFISKETAKLLSCVLLFNELYDKVDSLLIEIYGEMQAKNSIREFDRLTKEMKSVLYGFVNGSIDENITVINFNKI